MNKLDPKKIFSLFEQTDKEVFKEHGMEDVLKNPYAVIGNIVTGMETYYLNDQIYLNKRESVYPKIREKVKHKYFTKLYNTLANLNPEEVIPSYEITKSYDCEQSIEALGTLLYHFEDREEYEKCALIIKYLNIFK